MRSKKILFAIFTLILCACKGTDEGGESKPEGIVMNQISAASLSATVSCTFNDLSDKDLMYGRVVVLYSDSDNAADQFASWQNGNEKPDCQVFKRGTLKSGSGFEARLTGLQPDTEYSCCVGFASDDGSRRETSSLITFVTLPFNPEITTGAAASIRYFDAILDGTVSFAADTDADVCTTGLLLSTAKGATTGECSILASALGNKQQFALTAAGLKADTEYYYKTYASYKDAAGNDVSLACDTVVLSMGVRPRSELAHSFDGTATDAFICGDCAVRAGNITSAVRDGFFAAMNI